MLAARALSPRANIAAAAEAYRLVTRHRMLVLEMTKRELVDRYAGQVLGAAWAILTPLLMMGTYVWVFTFIFRGRLGETELAGPIFTAYVLSGLVAWLGASDAFARSTGAITGNANLVKQIVFPSEILPLKNALATLPTLAIGLAIAITISIVAGRADLIGLGVKLPFAVICYVLFLAGCCYFLAAVGVFFRDLKDIVQFLLAVGLFLHPILYPPGAAPPWLDRAFAFSPISHMIWCFRDAVVGAVDPHPWSWLAFPLWSMLSLLIGWRTFRMLKPSFGNAL